MLADAHEQVRIVDCWLDSASPDDWRDLYKLAAALAHERRNAVEVITMAADNRSSQALTSAGFQALGSDGIRYFSKVHKISSLHFQMIDSDAAYLGGGSTEFWS